MSRHREPNRPGPARCALQASSRVRLPALLALWLLLPFAQQAAAQSAPADHAHPVTIELKQFKVVTDAAGDEQLVDAATVRPGDIVEYRATYRNTAKAPVAGLVAELPIPAGMQYQARSAAPTSIAVEAESGGGIRGPEPLMRKVRLPDGTLREEPVPYADYRSLRWLVGRLEPGKEVVVRARVQVTPLVNDSEKEAATKQSHAAAAPAQSAG